jgi:hypothetical protein
MFVYLFRRNGDHALTTDITGRNLPARTPTSHWMFVKALEIDNCPPPLDIADFEEASRQLKHRLRLDQTIANGVAHEIGERRQAELPHGGCSMGFHRLQRHIEEAADLLVRATIGHQSHDARLPVTKSLFFPHQV